MGSAHSASDCSAPVEYHQRKYDYILSLACMFVHRYMMLAITDHNYMKRVMSGDFSKGPRSLCYDDAHSYDLSNGMIDVIMDTMHPAMSSYLADSARIAIEDPNGNISNLAFICGVTTKREWTDECPICYEDTHCSDMVIFRPCGHTICYECDSRRICQTCPMCRAKLIEIIPMNTILLPVCIALAVNGRARDYMTAMNSASWVTDIPLDDNLTHKYVAEQMRVTFNRSMFDCCCTDCSPQQKE